MVLSEAHRVAYQQNQPLIELDELLDWLDWVVADLVPEAAVFLSNYREAYAYWPSDSPEIQANFERGFASLQDALYRWSTLMPPSAYRAYQKLETLSRLRLAAQISVAELEGAVDGLLAEVENWRYPLLLADGQSDPVAQEAVEDMLGGLQALYDDASSLPILQSPQDIWQMVLNIRADDAQLQQYEKLFSQRYLPGGPFEERLSQTAMPTEFRFFLGHIESVLAGQDRLENLETKIIPFFDKIGSLAKSPQAALAYRVAREHFEVFLQEPRGGHLKRGSLALLDLADLLS